MVVQKKSTASANIRRGPISQFWASDRPRIFQSRKTRPISSYFTFARGGYIIRMSPIAIGMFVVPTSNRLISSCEAGTKYPKPKQRAIAREI